MKKRDYYEVLGVAREATEADIKKAYRRLARKLHPDVNPGDKSAQKKFQDVQEAYDILRDTEKRRAGDRVGDAGRPTGVGPPSPGAPPAGVGGGGGGGLEGVQFRGGGGLRP